MVGLHPTQQKRILSRYRWLLLFFLLPILGFLCLWGLFLFQNRDKSQVVELIPVNLHSELEADYFTGPNQNSIADVRLGLIWDVIHDREPGVTNLKDRQATLQNSLLTPVPIVASALSTCQGIYTVYAQQDTWLDSAHPTATHGSEPHLELGRNGHNLSRLLLHFPINDILPPYTQIHSAHLELDVEQIIGPLSAETLAISTLAAPFSEMSANQPESSFQNAPLVSVTTGTHVWNVTAIVANWFMRRARNNGLLLESTAPTNFTVIYYSREGVDQNNAQPSGPFPNGPRLVINCDGSPRPTPTIIAKSNTPTPTGTPGGQPSTVAPSAGPWLSPQVVTRKRWPKLLIDISWVPAGHRRT